jgi:MoaA/NifB/PqqE/SkfB family radical SAM enzyme
MMSTELNAPEAARLPYNVDLRLLGACNLRCPFCFGPRHDRRTMSAWDAMRVAEFLIGHGVRSTVISGGEPTLLKYLPHVLHRFKEAGIQTILSTNSLSSSYSLVDIAHLLDWIALPLDGPEKSINNLLRVGREDHFSTILQSLVGLRTRAPHVNIKLGTVVTRLNHDSVHNIPYILPVGALPDIWKIYQLSFTNYGEDNREILAVSDDEFEKTLERCAQTAANVGLSVTAYRNVDRNGKYLFIDPNGDAVAIQNGRELVIGNVLHDPDSLMAIWREYVDEVRLISNIYDTYPSSFAGGHYGSDR